MPSFLTTQPWPYANYLFQIVHARHKYEYHRSWRSRPVVDLRLQCLSPGPALDRVINLVQYSLGSCRSGTKTSAVPKATAALCTALKLDPRRFKTPELIGRRFRADITSKRSGFIWNGIRENPLILINETTTDDDMTTESLEAEFLEHEQKMQEHGERASYIQKLLHERSKNG